MWENRDIKLIKTEKRRNYLVSQPNYHTTKCFSETLLAIEMRKHRYSWTNQFGRSVKIRTN